MHVKKLGYAWYTFQGYLCIMFSGRLPFSLFMCLFCFNAAPQNPTSDTEPIDKDMIWAQLLSCRSAGYVIKPFLVHRYM